MKTLLVIVALSFAFFKHEEPKLVWVKEHEINVKPKAWGVDPLGNIIYADKEVIYKLDTSFSVQFKQSIKEFGEITHIDASHAQKSLVFSEDQQQIFFLDNTLTLTTNGLDLADEGIGYATHVSYSNQPTRYWVYDYDNFKLWLFDDLKNKPSVIENLNGVLNGLHVDKLFEAENTLFIWDKSKGVFLFDVYGSLIKKYEIKGADAITYFDGSFYYLKKGKLYKSLKGGGEMNLDFPEENVKELHMEEQDFYLQTDNKIIKYSLKK